MSLRVFVTALIVGLTAGCGDVASNSSGDGGKGVASRTSPDAGRADGAPDALLSDSGRVDGPPDAFFASQDWCANLKTCAGGSYNPALFLDVVIAGNATFCAEVLWALEANGQGDYPAPTTDYCESNPGPNCVDLCGDWSPYGMFTSEEAVPPPQPACMALVNCCAGITAPGGSAACEIIAEQRSLAYCMSVLQNFQERGFCG